MLNNDDSARPSTKKKFNRDLPIFFWCARGMFISPPDGDDVGMDDSGSWMSLERRLTVAGADEERVFVDVHCSSPR